MYIVYRDGPKQDDSSNVLAFTLQEIHRAANARFHKHLKQLV